jgi:hypothetical protein
MKINTLLILFFIIGCVLIAGYISKSIPITVVSKPVTVENPKNNLTQSNLTNASVPVQNTVSVTRSPGRLLVSIGKYNAHLPVFIDDVRSGNVSAGKPLNVTVSEGNHVIKICTETFCERAEAEIKPGVKTTLDFEERLNTDAPLGLLSISIGNYPADIPVYIDGTSVGVIASGERLNQSIISGNHSVKVCVDTTCFGENVTVIPTALTTLDFENQLQNNFSLGPLVVSIGGFNADLQVFIDNSSVGTVSMGKPLNLRFPPGNYTVRVCVGKVCEEENVQVRFAKQTVVDFGDRLKADVEFPSPTARIARYSLSGTVMTIDVELINPDTKDHVFTASVSSVYSFTDSQRLRISDSAQGSFTRAVKAGERYTQRVTLILSGGSNVIANEPVVIDVSIT